MIRVRTTNDMLKLLTCSPSNRIIDIFGFSENLLIFETTVDLTRLAKVVSTLVMDSVRNRMLVLHTTVKIVYKTVYMIKDKHISRYSTQYAVHKV